MEPVCSTILEEDPNVAGAIFLITAAAGAIYFHWCLAFWKINPVDPDDNRSEKAWEFVREGIADIRKKETPLDKSIYWAIALGMYGLGITLFTLAPTAILFTIINITAKYIC